MPEFYHILMADIVKSGALPLPSQASKILRRVVDSVNAAEKKQIISPLTITLGDEFQGVVKNCGAGIKIIFMLEEMLAAAGIPFRMRYILNKGRIDTPVNKKTSYGMLGPGLTETRKLLESQKNSRSRFQILYCEPGGRPHFWEDTLLIYQSVTDDWKPKDAKIISAFIQYKDYKTVAAKVNKLESQMWKKNFSLRMPEYFAIKRVITDYVH